MTRLLKLQDWHFLRDFSRENIKSTTITKKPIVDPINIYLF